ncbi:MAG: TetR family transcriptional regulator [Rhizobiales bacterium]|nr:TetR family transcriptional regulator [Hyphomicrobiales bacterium]
MVTKTTIAPRDRLKTEQTILDAIGRLILRDGLAGVGVNALAREAGIDKVLIYRYFGDLDGVYEAFAERGDFWWQVEDMLAATAEAPDLPNALKLGMRFHAREMRRRPVTLSVMAAETTNRTPLTIALETVREKRSLDLFEQMAARYPDNRAIDIPALTGLLGAAIDYLAIRSRSIKRYGGVDVGSHAGWERLFKTIDLMIDGTFADACP